jgi:hypothetical protein
VKDRKLKLLSSGTEENLSAATQYQDGTPVVGGWHDIVQRRRGDQWEDLSLARDKTVLDLAVRGTTLVACSGGVYTFDEASRTWQCELRSVKACGDSLS